jgi:CBS domain-containing protein
MLVKELMESNVITVKDSDSVVTICKLLSKHRISGVPVVNRAGKLVGFVSERDIIAAVSKPQFIKKTAKQIMSKKVKTITEDTPITHASKLFSQESYRHIPVTRNGKVVGIIARKDVATHMMKHYY